MSNPLFDAIINAPLGSPEREAAVEAYDADVLVRIGEWAFLTLPVAWAIQRKWGDELAHDPRCSSVEGWNPISGPGLLCDCGTIECKWRDLRAEQGLDDGDAVRV